MQMALVNVVRWLMIAIGLSLLPVYGLWIAGGAICDARERKLRAR